MSESSDRSLAKKAQIAKQALAILNHGTLAANQAEDLADKLDGLFGDNASVYPAGFVGGDGHVLPKIEKEVNITEEEEQRLRQTLTRLVTEAGEALSVEGGTRGEYVMSSDQRMQRTVDERRKRDEAIREASEAAFGEADKHAQREISSAVERLRTIDALQSKAARSADIGITSAQRNLTAELSKLFYHIAYQMKNTALGSVVAAMYAGAEGVDVEEIQTMIENARFVSQEECRDVVPVNDLWKLVAGVKLYGGELKVSPKGFCVDRSDIRSNEFVRQVETMQRDARAAAAVSAQLYNAFDKIRDMITADEQTHERLCSALDEEGCHVLVDACIYDREKQACEPKDLKQRKLEAESERKRYTRRSAHEDAPDSTPLQRVLSRIEGGKPGAPEALAGGAFTEYSEHLNTALNAMVTSGLMTENDVKTIMGKNIYKFDAILNGSKKQKVVKAISFFRDIFEQMERTDDNIKHVVGVADFIANHLMEDKEEINDVLLLIAPTKMVEAVRNHDISQRKSWAALEDDQFVQRMAEAVRHDRSIGSRSIETKKNLLQLEELLRRGIAMMAHVYKVSISAFGNVDVLPPGLEENRHSLVSIFQGLRQNGSGFSPTSKAALDGINNAHKTSLAALHKHLLSDEFVKEIADVVLKLKKSGDDASRAAGSTAKSSLEKVQEESVRAKEEYFKRAAAMAGMDEADVQRYLENIRAAAGAAGAGAGAGAGAAGVGGAAAARPGDKGHIAPDMTV